MNKSRQRSRFGGWPEVHPRNTRTSACDGVPAVVREGVGRMLRSLLLILLGFSAIVMDDASNALLAQDAYPRVYGPTGRPYGPTQAHYQYERQYGRPWYGGAAP